MTRTCAFMQTNRSSKEPKELPRGAGSWPSPAPRARTRRDAAAHAPTTLRASAGTDHPVPWRITSAGPSEFSYLSRHRSPQGHPRRGAEEPEVHPRSGERGRVAGHGDVAAGDQLAAGRGGQAVHHGDDGDWVVLDQHHDLEEQTHHFVSARERNATFTCISVCDVTLRRAFSVCISSESRGGRGKGGMKRTKRALNTDRLVFLRPRGGADPP